MPPKRTPSPRPAMNQGKKYMGPAPDKKAKPKQTSMGVDEKRALALGTDSAGGYAVPYQLDGKKKAKKKKGG